jgi:hypothetical protein
MKKILLSSFVAAAFAVGSANAQFIATDNAGNYGSGWTDGSNEGTGFSPWVLSSGTDTGFAGNFIGDPSAAGITGMGSQAFGLFANPPGSGSFSTADRSLTTPLAVGNIFSFQWSINFDSGSTGNKGFNLYTGVPGTGQIVNVNNGGSSSITFNDTDIGFDYGVNAMTWTFTQISPTSLSLSVNGRDGSGLFTTNISGLSGPVSSFRFYASDMQGGNEAQPYFNNLEVVPEPSTYALLTLGALALGGYAARRRARK